MDDRRKTQTDEDPEMPVLDKPPKERTPAEIREAIENEAKLKRSREP